MCVWFTTPMSHCRQRNEQIGWCDKNVVSAVNIRAHWWAGHAHMQTRSGEATETSKSRCFYAMLYAMYVWCLCVCVCCVAERHYERCVRVYCARHINISFSCQWRSLLVAVWFTLLRTMSGENLWFGGERQIFFFLFSYSFTMEVWTMNVGMFSLFFSVPFKGPSMPSTPMWDPIWVVAQFDCFHGWREWVKQHRSDFRHSWRQKVVFKEMFTK